MVDEYNGDMDGINASVAAAQAAAAAASASIGTTGTSTTSLTIGTGAKALTIQTGKVFVAGQWVAITHTANGANQMIGRIDSYDSGTGALGVTVAKATGAGTAASWSIGLTPAYDSTALQTTGGTMTGPIAEMGNGSSILDPGGTARAVGYRSIPLRAATSQQTLALTDVGRGISITTGGIIVPTNAAVPFAVGDAISIYNNSGSGQAISAAAGVTLRLAGGSSTGTRTLSQRGFCTLLKVATDEWISFGVALT
ncbi:hypothetical protein HY78_00925 [Rhizorhabdus wittichii DC-6]|nr:hypothetical protein HY78_00925 [Rhizorhabdus wittichii DC-6]